MMTHVDFNAIATALHSVRPVMPPPSNPTRAEDHHLAATLSWIHAVSAVAHTLARSNPRFDELKFMQACGVMLTNVTMDLVDKTLAPPPSAPMSNGAD